jgi:serine/threonine protein kinase
MLEDLNINYYTKLTMEIVISNKYKLGKLLGEGTFGKIFEGVNVLTNDVVAVKIEKKTDKSLLKHEANIYNRCKDIKGIPKIKHFGVEDDHNYMVIERLGDSIEQLREKCGGKLKLQTILIIWIQLINRLESLHNIGIIHRDIKPENLLIGLGQNRKMIYLIDFGLSRYYIDETGKHKNIITDKNLTGNIRYASLNVQEGIEPSRRDDLESLGYVFIWCLKGTLPWKSIHSSSKEQTYNDIKRCKREINLLQLCFEIPFEFIVYIDYCRNLNYDERPDYSYLKCLLMNLLKMKKFNTDEEFEWI